MQAVSESVFAVDDMFCGGCAATVERAVRRLPGVEDVSVSFLSDTAIVQHQTGVIKDSEIKEAIARLGYSTRSVDDPARASQSGKFEKHMRMRLGVALGFGLWVMMIGMVRLFIGVPTELMAWWSSVFAGLLSIPVLTYSAAPFLKLGWLGLRARVPGMDSLIFVATVAAVTGSVITLINGGSDVWFDVPVMLVTFQLIARLADFGAHRKASNAVRELLDLSPVKARRLNGTAGVEPEIELVPLAEVAVGDRVVSHAGERISMDGVVEAGSASVDTGLLNGESKPVRHHAGDQVYAGTLNLDGSLTLRITASLGKRRMDVLASSVGRLLNKKTNLMALADNVAFWLVPLLLSFAIVVFVTMLIMGSSSTDALERALAVLVVSCPCALSLAVPLVVSVTAARTAKEGIILRDASALDKARRVDTVFLDKTGTLTYGMPRVVGVLPDWSGIDIVRQSASFSSLEFDEALLIELAATAGTASHHPLMLAIQRASDKQSSQLGLSDRIEESEESFREYPGKGVQRVLAAGQQLQAGSRSWLESCAVKFTEGGSKLPEAESVYTRASEVCIALDGHYIGAIYLADELRDDAKILIHQLQSQRVNIKLVSGDRPESVKAVATTLGVDWVAEASPEDKAAMVENKTQEGHVVAFVGDGLNDGPALAAATLGIATGKASDLAKNAAAMAVLDGGLERIVAAMQIASKASRVLRSNIAWALLYNALMLPAALFGYVHPVMAVLAMALSTLSVSLNSLRAGVYRAGIDK